jgi:hypothetical protein
MWAYHHCWPYASPWKPQRLVNYDLHWNPTPMVKEQAASPLIEPHETVWIFNMFPDAGLEKLLGIVHRLSEKISGIDRAGFL